MSPEALLSAAGVPVARPTRLSGGDMGEVWRAGDWVVKSHPAPPAGLFPSEARSLALLRAHGVPAPEVRHASEDGLVMRWLGDGSADWTALADAVATMHGVRGESYGSDAPTFLGRFPLPAGRGSDWWPFFRERRLAPLLARTRGLLGAGAATVDRALAEVRPATEGPVLLHGDLWAGNIHFGADGPALIDPGCWWGERVVDLAMMRLFGGFPAAFWTAYEARLPIPPEVARGIAAHQLLYLLVHVQFFGRGYVDATVAAARRAVG